MSTTFGVTGGDLDFSVIDGVEAIRQQVSQALLLWLGEWYRDTTEGSNIRALLGGGNGNRDAIAESIEATVLTVDTVTSVRVESLTVNRRKISVRLRVTTSAGETVEVAM